MQGVIGELEMLVGRKGRKRFLVFLGLLNCDHSNDSRGTRPDLTDRRGIARFGLKPLSNHGF